MKVTENMSTFSGSSDLVVDYVLGTGALIQKLLGNSNHGCHSPDLRCVDKVLKDKQNCLGFLQLPRAKDCEKMGRKWKEEMEQNEEQYFFFLLSIGEDLVPSLKAHGHECLYCLRQLMGVAIEKLENQKHLARLYRSYMYMGRRRMNCENQIFSDA